MELTRRRKKRGSVLPEGFAPGEGNPQEKVGRGLRPRKGWNKSIQKRRNREIRLKIGIAKAFGGQFLFLRNFPQAPAACASSAGQE